MADRLEIKTRSIAPKPLSTRSMPIIPASFDRAKNTCRAIAASENPVMEYWGWEYGMLPTHLMMDGCVLPESGQVPLLDSHNRFTVEAVLGSARDFEPSDGQLQCNVNFAGTEEAQSAAQKVSEGHLTDFSIGRTDNDVLFVPEDTKAAVGGREFQGPCMVVRSWNLKELSLTPIGADQAAKARADNNSPEIHKLQPTKGEFRMDKKLLALLKGRGLADNATDAEALAYLTALPEADQAKLRQEAGLIAVPEQIPAFQQPESTEDSDKLRSEARKAERIRIRSIQEVCEIGGHPEMAQDFIDRDVTVDAARAAVFEKFKEGRQPVAPVVTAGTDERDKFRSAALDSLILRGGQTIEAPAPGSDELRGYSLRELARECLRMAGQSHRGNPMEMVGRAFQTSDLPNVLAAAANKFLLVGYSAMPETWRIWCGTRSFPDFKTANLLKLSEADDLDLIPEHGKYTYGTMSDSKEIMALATYGKLFAITRQAIINDDLSAFTTIPQKHGMAASRKIGDLVYSVLTTNAALIDGITLFHSSHGNVGTGGVPALATIAEAVKLMKLQKDIGGKQRLNIRAEYFIAPVALEGTMEQFFNSGLIGGATATDAGRANLVNPYAGTRFTRVYDARLDADSAVKWYMAGPKGMTVDVAFLNGVETPYLEQQQGWEVDGVEYKVRIDAAAGAIDSKALVYNAGA